MHWYYYHLQEETQEPDSSNSSGQHEVPTQQLQRPLPEPVDDVALDLACETIDDDLPLFSSIRSIDDPQPAVSQQEETTGVYCAHAVD